MEVYTTPGIRNSDVSADPYDNNTGQAGQTRVSHRASGFSATLDWDLNDNLATRVIASTRESEYKSGLDDDSFIDDFLSFPEVGEADQTSIEIQLNGDFGSWDFVSGIYYFDEEGFNDQPITQFLGFPGFFVAAQDVSSRAVYANLGFDVSEQFRVSAGLRYTEDDKDAVNEGFGPGAVGSSSFDEVSWDLSASFAMDNGMNVYGSIQSGYQSGQFPARPVCLFGDPDCFVASGNITAINYEAGIKGEPFDGFQMSAAVFYTEYSDLPYQVSDSGGGFGFNTVNLIVDQQSTGLEWESTLYLTDDFLFHASLGYIDVDVDEAGGVTPVAPLTPELTASLSPEYHVNLASGARVVLRADYSYRDEMWGEPSSDPARQTKIDSRDLINIDIAYHSPDGSWTAALYGRNVTDERYDNARINIGDYLLQILSNDASEFGLRFLKDF